jgi:iron-sulfur cluster repair protein YtfE (RIC family)
MQQTHPAPLRSIRQHFLEDHRRLEALMERVEKACADGDRQEIAKLWDDFDAGLVAHLEAEETFLFPALRQFSERDARALTEEHKHIRERLAELDAAVDLHIVRLTTVKEFIDELQAHAAHEDALLYARSDDVFSPDMHASVIKTLINLARNRRR